MSSELVVLAERYALEHPIASGGMATVWRARDDVLARSVAVKILHAHLAEDPQFLERFRREALAAASLAHPHIVSIYDTGREAGSDGIQRHYIVMEYCGAGSLKELLDKSGPMPPEQVVTIGSNICDALEYAHQSQIVHRDIKPANVLITDDGTLKVADFGIAKAAFGEARDITTTGSILGTVTYLSPEQVQGEEPTPRSDMYSMGVLLYELLAGRPPFAEESQLATAMKHVHEQPPPIRTFRARVPRELEAAILRALEKDPTARPASALELRSALAGMGTTAGSTTALPAQGSPAPTPRPTPTATPDDGPELWKLVGLVALVAVVIAGVFLLPSLFDRPANQGSNPGRGNGSGDRGQATVIEIQRVDDFDPYGGGSEHPEETNLAVDGNEGSAWTTETYSDPITALKPGVGLLFDLGSSQEVSEVEVTGSAGYTLELRAASEPGSEENDFEIVDEQSGAPPTTTFEGGEGRYWLVWITSLPGGEGGSASIAEVRFLAP